MYSENRNGDLAANGLYRKFVEKILINTPANKQEEQEWLKLFDSFIKIQSSLKKSATMKKRTSLLQQRRILRLSPA